MQISLHVSVMVAILSFPSWSFAGSPNAIIAGSCNNTASGFCNEFNGSSYKATNVEKSCTRQKMTFLAGTCPTEGRVGSCLMYKGKDNESYFRYYASFPGFGIKPKGGVAAAAEKQCFQMKGEWIPN
ncbi:MAG: hypothetical protein KJ900_08565 [Proteobacteria bacterium]|nr:hypothetical protein [Desulfocapsa sp.]MBU3943785.1 hypothetical protein [Pseudomonadota bacterium]MCG2744573.1 hypothetical protein [Desulfobacteraceae bacterium]MBU3983911.1 hypothetical protein [Pseudomonadota bacterium]MBU4027307.1 hypothetical protein [Pseudomonadota bacterium]